MPHIRSSRMGHINPISVYFYIGWSHSLSKSLHTPPETVAQFPQTLNTNWKKLTNLSELHNFLQNKTQQYLLKTVCIFWTVFLYVRNWENFKFSSIIWHNSTFLWKYQFLAAGLSFVLLYKQHLLQTLRPLGKGWWFYTRRAQPDHYLDNQDNDQDQYIVCKNTQYTV